MFSIFKREKEPASLDERLTTVERQLRALQVEWMDTLDRLKSMMGRIVKDRARTEQMRGPSPDLSASEEPEAVAGHSGLTSRQETLNQQILARRRTGRSN